MSRLSVVRPALPGVARVLLAAGVATGAVWAATARPDTLDLAAATGVTEAPVAPTSLATSTDAMCPGPELTGVAGVDDVRTGGRVTAVAGPADLLPVPATGSGNARASAGSVPLVTLSARPATGTGDLPRTGPVALRAQGALAPAVAATQEWSSGSADLRGLVTTPCRSAATDLWLLGGGDGPGRLERLVLANPGGNPVTADVTVHGADGPVGPARTETVPPGGRTTLLLDAVAADEKTPAVHVAADGGGLTAFLSDTWVDGTTPLGAETTVPAADPATVQVVPAALLGDRATLRVVAPGGDEAVASVTLLGRDGPVTTTADTVLTVGAEGVAELPLPSVPAGTYAVVVRADVPVVAGVMSRVGDPKGAGDIGWAVSGPVVDEVAGLALPPTPGVGRTLHLVSTGGASTAEVTVVVGGEARTRTVSLLSDRSADVDLAGAESVWVERTDGSGALRGGVVSTSGSGAQQLLSEVPLAPTAVTSPVSRAFPLP
ncbi:hypothetical protein KMZ32_10655 [Phycicoccus sp. MAQZ13P-2]|uniref:DUF5719 family protein n=1 Tax=Phycicoccus mangrovi TaxID=2840470 RepID=UPI001C000D5D|nr:DUF5719 family protein [Phycicoccus mangrovi]MBT9255935.1 hypothetical protein [Phycicoccus mangrovi]MBT9274529.1 hypothetical protein [Phycicoccus mangrovi]